MSLTNRLGPNEAIIGRAGWRDLLQTPSLVLDLDAMQSNMSVMANFLSGRRQKLRPHTKTHKSINIAKMQMDAGAVGVCCTTLGEAEVMIAGGAGNVLITSPVVGQAKIERLARLNGQAAELIVVVDHPQNAQSIADAARAAGKPLAVLVDVDPGGHRTGVADADAAVALARLARDTEGLVYRGVQSYAGGLQHIYDYSGRKPACDQMHVQLRAVCDALSQADLAPAIITGGGTGTFTLDLDQDVLTDLQVGSYLFMDVDYNLVEHADSAAPGLKTALFVLATVVSVNAPGLATVDAGTKCLATDGRPPEIDSGTPQGTTYRFAGDEHGIIQLADVTGRMNLGDRVLCTTPHCDPTVNLHDRYHCVRGEKLEAIWPVDGRGRSL